MPDEQTCENCRFMFSDMLTGGPICRRMPPTAIVLKADAHGAQFGLQTTSAHPPIPVSRWCGEWRQKAPATVTVLQSVAMVPLSQRDPEDENPPH